MSRTLTSAMQTAVAAEAGYADIWFLELASSGGTLRYTTAPSTVSWNSLTWVGIGGAIVFEPPSESSDYAAQSFRLSLSGVDQGVITEILTSNLRGRDATIWWGQVLLSPGVVVLNPLEIFTGLMNDPWEITEDPPAPGQHGTVRVETGVVSQLARHLYPRATRTNVESHESMLDRAGLTATDEFFERVPGIVNKPVYWGMKAPARSQKGTGKGGGGREDNGTESKDDPGVR